jgi:hypothetical protein
MLAFVFSASLAGGAVDDEGGPRAAKVQGKEERMSLAWPDSVCTGEHSAHMGGGGGGRGDMDKSTVNEGKISVA